MGAQGTEKGFSGDLVLDAGALIALEKGSKQLAGLVRNGTGLGLRIVVPASVLAQVWRGGPRSASVARLIDANEVDSLDEARAKEVGARLGSRRRYDIADAHVVCCALEHRAVVASSDEGDIRALSDPKDDLTVIPV